MTERPPRLPLERSGLENPLEVFTSIADTRETAQQRRAAYLESITTMGALCKQLRGVEVLLSGRIEGRSGARVRQDSPEATVDKLHVRIGDAKVETYESHGSHMDRFVPYISINAWSVEAGELICAQLGVGDFGVSVELIETTESPI
jgi:hypothetical protein